MGVYFANLEGRYSHPGLARHSVKNWALQGVGKGIQCSELKRMISASLMLIINKRRQDVGMARAEETLWNHFQHSRRSRMKFKYSEITELWSRCVSSHSPPGSTPSGLLPLTFPGHPRFYLLISLWRDKPKQPMCEFLIASGQRCQGSKWYFGELWEPY